MNATAQRRSGDGAGRRPDPDRLAILEEERAFLLRSLDDLDAEHQAGDLEDDDYQALRDDYVRRTADVSRRIEGQKTALATAPRTGWKQIMVWVVGLALLGGLSGAVIARAAGDRAEGDEITGGLRSSIESRLTQARTLFGDPERWDDAIEIFDSIVEEQPGNTEALTYRAWLQNRQGAPAEDGLAAWEEVSRIDPDYPDAKIFRVIALADLARHDEAAELLDTLDLASLDPFVGSLLTGRGIIGEVYGETRYDQLADGASSPSLDELGVSVDTAFEMAGYLLRAPDKPAGAVAALKLYDAVLDVEPDEPAALSRSAFLLVQSGLVDRAIERLDQAVQAAPDNAEARVTRATVLAASDPAAACVDLDAVAALDPATLPSALADQAAAVRARLDC